MAPTPYFLAVGGEGCCCCWWWWFGGRGVGGLTPFMKVWVFDSVPYSLKLKNSPISNSFHMDVLWCGNCFSLYSVWCFAMGTLYSCSVSFFSSWFYNGSGSYLTGGRKLVLIWNVNLLVFLAKKRNKNICQPAGFTTSVKTRGFVKVCHLTFWPGLQAAVKAELSCPILGAAALVLTVFKWADSCLKGGRDSSGHNQIKNPDNKHKQEIGNSTGN